MHLFDALLWVLIAIALASLRAMLWGVRLPARATFIVATSTAAALAFARWGPAADIPARQVSWSCAGLSLIGSIAAAFSHLKPRRAGETTANLATGQTDTGMASLLAVT